MTLYTVCSLIIVKLNLLWMKNKLQVYACTICVKIIIYYTESLIIIL